MEEEIGKMSNEDFVVGFEVKKAMSKGMWVASGSWEMMTITKELGTSLPTTRINKKIGLNLVPPERNTAQLHFDFNPVVSKSNLRDGVSSSLSLP